jgi:hypothetical protein
MLKFIQISLILMGITYLLCGCTMTTNSNPTAAQATTRPVAHPFAAAENTIHQLHQPLLLMNVLGILCLAISIGLLFTPISSISKIAIPVSGSVVALSLFGLIVLPFAPWIIAGVFAVALAWGGYELYEKYSTKKTSAVASTVVSSSSTAVVTPSTAEVKP